MPAFNSSLRNLQLTLFDNAFRGRLKLPGSANFSVLFAQANFLSCGIVTGGATTVDPERNLLLPGNIFSSPIPHWAATSDVSFLYYSSWWQAWGLAMVTSLVGLACLSGVLLLAKRESQQAFSDFFMRLLRSGQPVSEELIK